MASILKVDEMQGVTSADDITITDGSVSMKLQQGVVKAYGRFDQRSSLSTVDSFNISSTIDFNPGQIIVRPTNNMSDANYSIIGMAGYFDGTSGVNSLVPGWGLSRTRNVTTSEYTTQTTTAVWDGSAGTDVDNNMTAVLGDLA
ncbi:MAG: hypothetical protein DWQ28_06390 [Proteobacteria bacterium]|nr:MAG: hypothetical protein DWQ28_06390 [Pseudomonadota bacterium]